MISCLLGILVAVSYGRNRRGSDATSVRGHAVARNGLHGRGELIDSAWHL